MAVVAYSPFGHGHVPGARTSASRVMQEIADAHNATARQVGLRFLLRRSSVFAIPKAAAPEHAAAASNLEPSLAELARIDAAFPRGPRPRGLPTR